MGKKIAIGVDINFFKAEVDFEPWDNEFLPALEKLVVSIIIKIMEKFMNEDRIAGQWNIIKGKIKEKWGKLTDDDLTEINGQKDQLLGKIQKRYGIAKDQAQEEFEDWEDLQQDTALDEELENLEDENTPRSGQN